MIEPGTYRARAVGPEEVRFGMSNSGNEQVSVLFELIDESVAGQRMTWFGSFASDKATEITIKALRNCGWDGVDMMDMTGINTGEVDLVVVCEADEQGTNRTKIKWVNKPGDGRVDFKNPMSDGQRVAFAQRMKGRLLAEKQGQSRAQPARGAGPTGQQASRLPPQGRSQAAPQRGQSYDDYADQFSGSGATDDIPF